MLEMNAQDNQRGSVTTEFVMVVPLLALAMLLLLGLGYTLMTKQNAIAGARAAVFYRATLEQTPPAAAVNAMIKNAVSPGREEWTLEFHEGHMENPPQGEPGDFGSAIGGLYSSFNQEISYTARGTATLGFLPRVMSLGQAQSSYYLPQGTWTCAQTGGGSYTAIALSTLHVPDIISGFLDLSCCQTYEASHQ